MNHQAHRFTGYGVKLQSSRTAAFQRDVLHIWPKVFSACVLKFCIEAGHVCLKPLYTGWFWAVQNSFQWWHKIAQWDAATDGRFRADEDHGRNELSHSRIIKLAKSHRAI